MPETKSQKEQVTYVRKLMVDLAAWAERSDNASLMVRYKELSTLPDKELLAFAKRHDIRN
jgi:hypothetical protein